MFAKYEKKPLGCLQITPLLGLRLLDQSRLVAVFTFHMLPNFSYNFIKKKKKKNACAAIFKVFWDKVFDSILSQ